MREEHAERVLIPEHEETMTSRTVKCDGCGKPVSPDGGQDDFAHELVIALDQDECVSFYRQRDYCPSCLERIWREINRLIRADPDCDGDDRYQ